MPKLNARLPKYSLHRRSGLAVVFLGGKAIYLGPHGSPESKTKYREVVGDWLKGRSARPAPTRRAKTSAVPAATNVATVLLAYREHARAYYTDSREVQTLGEALRPLRLAHGKMPLDQLRPEHIRAIRAEWIAAGLARSTINNRVNRIKRFLRWAVAHEHAAPDTLGRIAAIEALKSGRMGVRETGPVEPVEWELVAKTLEHLPAMVRDLVLFLWHTGARPGEATALTTGDIDMGGDVWYARPRHHKNAYRGQDREIPIGPKAQEALRPWLLADPDRVIFSPMRVDDRQTRRRGRRLPGERYSRCGLGQAIRRACDRAGVERWHPSQLRHSAATRLRSEGGIDAAATVLGHADPGTTLIYAARDRDKATELIRRVG